MLEIMHSVLKVFLRKIWLIAHLLSEHTPGYCVPGWGGARYTTASKRNRTPACKELQSSRRDRHGEKYIFNFMKFYVL